MGEASIGITAGKGMDGAGDTDRLDENDDLRLWLMTLGGFIGRAIEVGVPGMEGFGDPATALGSRDVKAGRLPNSGGAGL